MSTYGKMFGASKAMPHASPPNRGPTCGGGRPEVKPIPYREPQGPKGIPGTGNKATSHGPCGSQHKG